MSEEHAVERDSPFEVVFRPDTAALAQARHRFEQWVGQTGPAPDTAEDLAVVFSEVASNAVEAHDGTGEPVAVRAWRDSDDIVLSVTNKVSRRNGVPDRWNLDDPLRGGGRGLMIVRALTDDVDVAVVDQTVTVECRLRVESPEGGAPSRHGGKA